MQFAAPFLEINKLIAGKEEVSLFKNMKTNDINWILLLGLTFLFLEVAFFDGGFIFSAALSIGFAYIGRKKYERTYGKILFWMGVLLTVVLILNMMALKLFILVLLILFLYNYYQSNHNAEIIKPTFTKPDPMKVDLVKKEALVKSDYLFQNKLFGYQDTEDRAYEWNDINIQSGLGDIVIDLSNTVLLQGENVISIRSVIGNIQVLVPYDTEVSVHHSVVIGRVSIFGHKEQKNYNQIVSMHTAGYQNASRKIKIITSIAAGDIEVKRI